MFGEDASKVAFDDPIEILFSHFHWKLVVNAEASNLVKQVTRVTPPESTFGTDEVSVQQIVNDFWFVFAFEFLGIDLKEDVELFGRRIADFNLVRDASQKRVID